MTMSLSETLLQPAIWFALLMLVMATAIVIPLADYTQHRLPSLLLRWQWEHVAIPLLRILLLLLFIVLAYPELYGLHSASAFGTVVSTENGHTYHLINILFILAVLLPLVPVIGDWQALALPLQGATAVALIFSWMPGQHMSLSGYWPGTLTLLLLLALAWLSYRIAMLLGHTLGPFVDRQFHLHGSTTILGNIFLLILQTPLIIIYAHSLGRYIT